MDLKNKKVLVTGASSGIGKEIAKAFVENGSDIAIISSSEPKLYEAWKELNLLKVLPDQKIIYNAVDVSKYNMLEASISKIILELKDIDILINNAGITKDNLIMKMIEEDFDRVIEVNLKSIYNTCKILSRLMIKKRKGKIINIGSIIGLIGNAGQANYAASKAAIYGFSKSLAKELGSRNICVNCIAPGFIMTKMTETIPENLKEKMLTNIPLKKFGTPRDVANLVLFLSSNKADYITGQVLTIDGGMVM